MFCVWLRFESTQILEPRLSRFGLSLHFSYLTASRRNSPSFPPQSRIPSGESERHPLYSVCQFCQPPFNSLCLLLESTKQCLASMKNNFLDSSHVIDSALTPRLRPEHPWMPCGPPVMRQCRGITKTCSKLPLCCYVPELQQGSQHDC